MISFRDWGYKPPLIHVGFSKALSTWLQEEFFKESNGYWVAMDPWDTARNIINIPSFHFEIEKIKSFLDVKLTSNKELRPVITSEALSGNMRHGGFDAENLAVRLRECFKDAKILIIFREQKKLIRSLYSEVVKWGIPYSLEHFIDVKPSLLCPEYQHEYLYFDKLISFYQKLFGKENVLAIPFELFSEEPKTFINKINKHSQIDENKFQFLDNLNYNKKHNAKFGFINLNIQRHLNYISLNNPYSIFNLNRDFKKLNISASLERRKKLIPSILENHFENRFIQTIDKMTKGVFKESNKRLQKLTPYDLRKWNYEL